MTSRILLAGVSVVALATAITTTASAQTSTTTVYGGGGTLAAKVYRDIFNCYSSVSEGVYGTSPGNTSTSATYPVTRAAGCTSSPNNAVGVGYEPVGSGAGLNAFTSGNPANFGSPSTTNTIAYLNSAIGLASTPYPEIQFAGSDAYLNSTQAMQSAAIDKGSFQLPTLATPIALPVGSVKSLALTTADVCGIFSGNQTTVGKVTISKVVVRADGSGTSFIFSDWLSLNCPASDNFNATNGFPSTLPNWAAVFKGPSANLVAATGSGGVAQIVNTTPDAIAYVSPDYVQPVVKNNDYPATVNGVAPTVANVTTRLKQATYPKTYDTATIGSTINNSLISPGGSGYPIVGFTFIDTYECYGSVGESANLGVAQQGTELFGVLSYLYSGSGQVKKILNSQGFVPAPSTLVKLLKSANAPLNTKTGIQNSGC